MLRPLVALLVLSASAAAGQFTPNHLFACAPADDLVLEVDPAGDVVWQLGQGSGLVEPAGLAFGADGLLYVSSFGTSRVLAFDSGGNLVRTLGAGSPLDGPRGLAIGPDGSLYVASSGGGTIERFATSGVHLATLASGLDLPGGLAFGADGHLFVACAGDGLVVELDEQGRRVRALGGEAGLLQPSAVVLVPDGQIAVASSGSDLVVLLDGDGLANGQLAGDGILFAPTGLVRGPDGNLWVAAEAGGLLALDAAGAVVQALPVQAAAGALAFAPRRFPVTLKGTLTLGGQSLALKESATLALDAGAATVLLHFQDGASGSDLASVFGADALALRGQLVTDAAEKKRRLSGTARLPGDGGPASASLLAELTGSPDANGMWLPATALGQLWRGGTDAGFSGTLKAGKPLP
jgi:outer membrane protein assembly factor BamB